MVIRRAKMEIFMEHKVEWVIGIVCTFLPVILGELIKRTSKIPDITIPFWLLCLFIGLIAAYSVIHVYSNKTKDVANKSYGVERVVIDGKHFVNCTFDGTELVFTGKRGFSLSGNHFKTNPRISFDGNAALTISELIAMYSDDVFRPIIEATFDNIKKRGLEKKVRHTMRNRF
jgi:hypothetical protein